MTLGSSSASPKRRPLGIAVSRPSGSPSATERASDAPLACRPELSTSTIASPARSSSPRIGPHSGAIRPIAEPASSMSSGETRSGSAGDSPPPHAAPEISQARCQPVSSDCSAVESACQSERPVAKYALMTIGSAPTEQTSLTIAPTASMATSAKRSSPETSIQRREMIDFVPRPSTTNASCWPPSSSTNADAPREASTARPPCCASRCEVDCANEIASRLDASSTS